MRPCARAVPVGTSPMCPPTPSSSLEPRASRASLSRAPGVQRTGRMEADTRIGKELAGYRIESLIGRGGMSVGYLAEHLGLGRKVALKILAPELSDEKGFRE